MTFEQEIKKEIEELTKQKNILGLTGIMGCGKSTVGKQFLEYGQENQIQIINMELDDIAKEVYTNPNTSQYDFPRKQLEQILGKQIRKADGTIDEKQVSKAKDKKLISIPKIVSIIGPYISLAYLPHLQSIPENGLGIYNAALIIDHKSYQKCNNNILFVTINPKTAEQRGWQRDKHKYDTYQEYLNFRAEQDSENKKIHEMKQDLKNTPHNIWYLNNSNEFDDIERLRMHETFEQITKTLLQK